MRDGGTRLSSTPLWCCRTLCTRFGRLPGGDGDFPVRWRLIKASFSRGLPQTEGISVSRLRKPEREAWQRRYWEHTLRDEDDFARRLPPLQPGRTRLSNLCK
jgi:hypothetical protein